MLWIDGASIWRWDCDPRKEFLPKDGVEGRTDYDDFERHPAHTVSLRLPTTKVADQHRHLSPLLRARTSSTRELRIHGRGFKDKDPAQEINGQ